MIWKKITNRDYKPGYKTPLDYFNDYFSEEGKERIRKGGRARFMGFFPDLCTSLYRYKQMDEAIPEKLHSGGRRLKPSKIERIKSSHSEFDGNARKASIKLKVATSTIIRYWEKEKYTIRRKGRPPKVS